MKLHGQQKGGWPVRAMDAPCIALRGCRAHCSDTGSSCLIDFAKLGEFSETAMRGRIPVNIKCSLGQLLSR